jgi:hypothetical protein
VGGWVFVMALGISSNLFKPTGYVKQQEV